MEIFKACIVCLDIRFFFFFFLFDNPLNSIVTLQVCIGIQTLISISSCLIVLGIRAKYL